jgi:hypothetical protein
VGRRPLDLAHGRRHAQRLFPDHGCVRELRGDFTGDLHHEERISGRARVHGARDRRRGRPAHERGEDARDFVLPQALHAQHLANLEARGLPDHGCEWMAWREPLVAVSSDDEDRVTRKIAEEELDETQRGHVRPVEVVEQQDEGAHLRRRRQQARHRPKQLQRDSGRPAPC